LYKNFNKVLYNNEKENKNKWMIKI
jgi:hypothetical protein